MKNRVILFLLAISMLSGATRASGVIDVPPVLESPLEPYWSRFQNQGLQSCCTSAAMVVFVSLRMVEPATATPLFGHFISGQHTTSTQYSLTLLST